MAKTLYVDSDSDTGSDANPGTHPFRPKRTLQGALASAQASDTLLMRKGRLYEGAATIALNDITVDEYSLGTELNSAPMLRLARGRGACLTVSGRGVAVNRLDVWDADVGLDVTGADFRSTGAHVHKFGFGIVLKASGAELKDPAFFQGRMKSNTGAKTDAGAQAITLWKVAGVPHAGTRITGAYAEDMFAASLAFGVDGAMFEIFGAIEDAEIRDCVGRNLATFMEVGGPKGAGGAVSNVRVIGCFAENTNGRVLFVNSPDEDFYVDWRGFVFDGCTFIADDDEASPFFMAGDHGSLKDRLTVKNSIIQATSQIYNAGTGTDLKSMVHEKNIYHRPDRGTGIGVPMVNGDALIQYNPFFNATAHDYRLPPRSWPIGAMGTAQSLDDELVLSGLMRSPKTPYKANELKGGFHAVSRWQDMTAIPSAYRVPGMRCTVLQHRMTYALQENKTTWMKVGGGI